MWPTVCLLADTQQSISFASGPVSLMSQEADRNTQPGQTLYIHSANFPPTAVQINVKESLRKFNLVIVLAAKSAVQRGPPFYGQIPASVCENKWILCRSGPKSHATADILEWEAIILLFVFMFALEMFVCVHVGLQMYL